MSVDPTAAGMEPPEPQPMFQSRRRAAFLLLSAVLAVAAIITAAVVARIGEQAPHTGNDYVAACRRHFESMNPGATVPTPRMVIVLDNDRWVRLYQLGDEVSICLHTEPNLVQTFTAGRLTSAPRSLQLFGGLETILKGGMLYGTVPEGTDRVEAVLATGETVKGSTDGTLFAIWSPGANYAEAHITAYRRNEVFGTAIAPTLQNQEVLDETAFAAMCQRQGEAILRSDELRPRQQAMPPRRFTLGDEGRVVWVYADEQVIITCTWSGDDGQGVNGYFLDDRRDLAPRLLADDSIDLNWVIGHVPADTKQVDVVLPGGRTVPATLSGAFYAASWSGQTGLPIKIIAHTSRQIITHEAGKTTSRPR